MNKKLITVAFLKVCLLNSNAKDQLSYKNTREETARNSLPHEHVLPISTGMHGNRASTCA